MLQAAAAADEAAIVVAVQNSNQTALERSFAKETIRFLSDSNYDRSIIFKKLPLDQITKLAQERKIDFALLGPDAYAAMEIHFGAHALCSQRLISDESKKVSGAAVLISADNKNIRELSDLTRVAVSKDESRAFFVKAFKRELLQLDSDADRGKNISIELFSQSETQLLDLLLSSQISALLLPAGALEKLKSSDASAAKLLKVVGETSSNPNLASSSSLYPGLTFAAFPSSDSETAARLTASLLGMPSADGYEWSLPTTFEFVHELLSVIRDADYLKRPDQSLLTLLKEYWMYLCFALLAVLALIIHSLRTEVLVKRRTAQLTLALKEREAMKEEVNAYIKRLAYMERIGMVGEISSMLAHELK
ncbi:PhnD/SsuA/transferrin family substrate-binding protein [Parasutterella muris]|uniref:PhnD/SsuA/transferrin family substrate-binding protein n=2 Tax=Parasutterella TaxID=577310 RepID=UPI00203F9F2D|nr:PhnD/SsuA/transferrin family substrate-binding protein [Parasutterella muris]